MGSDLPQLDDTWGIVSFNDSFSGYDEHAWFYKKVVVPANLRNKNIYLRFSTNVYGWDAVNPQFIVYINGKIVQALDVNHTMVKLDSSLEEFDLHLYAYTGSSNSRRQKLFQERIWYRYEGALVSRRFWVLCCHTANFENIGRG